MTGIGWQSRRYLIEEDHPSFPGHFPGNPILPGAVLLDHICQTARTLCGWQVTGFSTARFTRPLLPGSSVDIWLRRKGATEAEVECWADGDRILRSTVKIDATAAPVSAGQ